ncbi:MAG: thioredoxin family protein, partial [Chitinophagaceae bacterium]
AILVTTFTIYMIPGLWGAPLKLLSGFIPPATTQDFNLHELKYSLGKTESFNTIQPNATVQPPKKLVDKLKVPFGLTAYFDLEEGMAAAKVLNKPVMLDFTGHSCANCRKMEEEVWSNPEVLKRIKNNFVLISLYVDEKTDLPIAEHYTDVDGKKITNVGDKNLDYEKTKFGFRAQPLYKFLDTNGNSLSDVNYGYDANIEKFIKHLDAVKAKFDAGK